ncbi:hypothetical protein PM8797T_17077 [Gimesia maris DSM 8797]|nr:hypothetical protein PM8797T_17077 [Gimesia maris DSM 8797]
MAWIAQREFRTESRTMTEKYRNKKNKGVMFRRRYKENANQPDFVGSFTIENGREYEFAGWNATGRKSLKPYVRLRVAPKGN